MAEWSNGASLTPAELGLLRQAAEVVVLRPPKREEEATRRANVVDRVLTRLGLVDSGRRDGGRPGDVRKLFGEAG